MGWHSLERGEQGTSAAHRVHGDMTNQRWTVHGGLPQLADLCAMRLLEE